MNSVNSNNCLKFALFIKTATFLQSCPTNSCVWRR